MIEYLIESTLCLAVFYIVFEVFFKRARNYQINRAVLLFSVFFSLLVPALSISISTLPIQEIEQSEGLFEVLSVPNYLLNTEFVTPIAQNSSVDLSFIFVIAYLFITLILFIRFAFHIINLIVKWRKSDKINHYGHELVLMDEKVSPFTFFNSIFISKTEYQSGSLEKELLIHETAHKYQLHSVDVVFIELLQVLFWFNPFIYLFKRLIKTNHEYLADDFVLKSGASYRDYTDKLLCYTFPRKTSTLTSGFGHALIKQRLIMLSKFQQKKPVSYRFLLLVPVVCLLFLTTAFTSTSSVNILPEYPSHQVKNGLENPGTLLATTIFWSSEDNEVYLKGKNVRIKHGDNDFSVNGTASYLGEVYYFVFNNQEVTKDLPIDVSGKKYQVVKLSKENAIEKYGSKGRSGAVEITVL